MAHYISFRLNCEVVVVPFLNLKGKIKMDNPFNYNLVPMDPLMGMGVTMGIPMEFQNDPISYLSAIASTSPSYQAWEKLSGPVAYWFHEGKKKRKKSGDKDINNDNNDDVEDIDNDNNNNNNDNEDTPNDDFPTNREEEQSVLASYAPVAAAYLHAAAVHLELLLTTTTTNNSSSSRGIDTGRTEMNSVRTRAQDEIVEVRTFFSSLSRTLSLSKENEKINKEQNRTAKGGGMSIREGRIFLFPFLLSDTHSTKQKFWIHAIVKSKLSHTYIVLPNNSFLSNFCVLDGGSVRHPMQGSSGSDFKFWDPTCVGSYHSRRTKTETRRGEPPLQV